MEQPSQQPAPEQKNKIGAKEIISIILVATAVVLVKFGVRALFSGGSSSSSSSSIQVDLDIPEREPIDFKALVDDAFEESANQDAPTN